MSLAKEASGNRYLHIAKRSKPPDADLLIAARSGEPGNEQQYPMNITDPQLATATPKLRWFRLTPDRVVIALLAVEVLLWLSERLGWLAWHKGYAVLAAVAVVAVALLLMLLWFLFALLFRRQFQFSIRSLLMLTVVIALPCSWVAVQKEQAKRQKEAVKAIEHLGGQFGMVSYDWQRDSSGNFSSNTRPPGPSWLLPVLGEDFFQRVVYAYLRGSQIHITNDELKHLKALSELQELDIEGADVTEVGLENLKGLTKLRRLILIGHLSDAGLKYLKELSQLRSLDLCLREVTDAGLEHLKEMTQLRSLDLYLRDVTDAGLEHLKEMTQLRSLILENSKVTDAGLEHLKGLSQLDRLRLWNTKVTDAGAKKLQNALPKCNIYWAPPIKDERQSPAKPDQPGG